MYKGQTNLKKRCTAMTSHLPFFRSSPMRFIPSIFVYKATSASVSNIPAVVTQKALKHFHRMLQYTTFFPVKPLGSTLRNL